MLQISATVVDYECWIGGFIWSGKAASRISNTKLIGKQPLQLCFVHSTDEIEFSNVSEGMRLGN